MHEDAWTRLNFSDAAEYGSGYLHYGGLPRTCVTVIWHRNPVDMEIGIDIVVYVDEASFLLCMRLERLA